MREIAIYVPLSKRRSLHRRDLTEGLRIHVENKTFRHFTRKRRIFDMAKRMLRKPFETNLANVENNERPTKLLKDPRHDNYLKDFDDEITVPEKIKRIRESLPIFDKKEVILDAIRGSQVVLIKGETGCGKTTQVPQYILEDRINHGNGSMTNILVTQPRRISAVSMANRVAEERGEKMGQNNGPQVR